MAHKVPPEQIEFRYDRWEPALERVVELTAARGGWINLLPEATDHDDPEAIPGTSFVSTLLRGRTSIVPMGTWVAPTDKKAGTIGVSHGVREKVVPRLREAGVFAPDAWKLVQDNARRGLVVSLPPEATPDEILHWLMSAVDELCPVVLTGNWLAEVHRP